MNSGRKLVGLGGRAAAVAGEMCRFELIGVQGGDRLAAAGHPHLVKTTYDPDNVFRSNVNIEPTGWR
jgi:hypothetical protein